MTEIIFFIIVLVLNVVVTVLNLYALSVVNKRVMVLESVCLPDDVREKIFNERKKKR